MCPRHSSSHPHMGAVTDGFETQYTAVIFQKCA
uniref:Uncharacterized protein n=1 Tax=Anguilla anguilla TaxID=7936 RepID=A0A0E9W5Z2_ANGAN